MAIISDDGASRSGRLVHVEQVWGTAVSLHLLGSDDDALAATRDEIVELLHHVDDVFSAYRDDSLLMQWQRKEATASPELQDVLALAGTVSVLTHGAYDVRWNGEPDPTGVVKGWAVDRAVDIAARNGVINLVINADGDLSTRGASASGLPWQIGISDPADRTQTILTAVGNELNVATSGPGELGEHIKCRSQRTAVSATVLGPNLAVADGIATAAIAAGAAAPKILDELDESGWLSQVVGIDGSVWRSPKLAQLMGG
ncbi:MAG TPA: FAD:protein FMN transferase [Mycobacteriales bacterium]|nr:FAD:protein FMN transferase [Mycobacteriales bacterium]